MEMIMSESQEGSAMNGASTMEDRLATLIQQGAQGDQRVQQALRLFAEASQRVPAPAMVNSGKVHYSTSSQS